MLFSTSLRRARGLAIDVRTQDSQHVVYRSAAGRPLPSPEPLAPNRVPLTSCCECRSSSSLPYTPFASCAPPAGAANLESREALPILPPVPSCCGCAARILLKSQLSLRRCDWSLTGHVHRPGGIDDAVASRLAEKLVFLSGERRAAILGWPCDFGSVCDAETVVRAKYSCAVSLCFLWRTRRSGVYDFFLWRGTSMFIVTDNMSSSSTGHRNGWDDGEEKTMFRAH